MISFRGKLRTDERTDERTNGSESIGPTSEVGGSKNRIEIENRIEMYKGSTTNNARTFLKVKQNHATPGMFPWFHQITKKTKPRKKSHS